MRPRDDERMPRLELDGVTAVVSRRAAALRLLRVAEVDLVEPTTTTEAPPGMAGAVLVPWPNRVEGAVWWHEGIEHRLPVSEPALGNAIHGLLTEVDFETRERSAAGIRLGARIDPIDGYPFTLDVEVAYALHGAGIDVAVTLENLGDDTAPVAVGAHPYLRVGDAAADQVRLSIAAAHEWPLDETTHLPSVRRAMPGGLRQVPAADAPRHSTFEADVGDDGPIVHELLAPDGRSVQVYADPACRFTQLWRPDALAADDGMHPAIAIEPMTAPPNALRTGVGLHRLSPGASWTVSWGIRFVEPDEADRSGRPLGRG